MVHNRELASPLWFSAPAGRNRIPNAVLQPLILIWVLWTGWQFTTSNVGDQAVPFTEAKW